MKFIQMPPHIDNDIDIDDDDEDQILVSKDDYVFIDDSKQINGNDVDFYRGFDNVTRDLNEPIGDHEDWLNKRDLQPEKYLSHD